MTLLPALQSAVSEWVASGGDEAKERAVLELLERPEIRSLPYAVRNREFLTSSKLKAFRDCPYHSKLAYIDCVDMGFEDAEYFVIGQALDDLLTLGRDKAMERYAVVARRTDKAAEENSGKTLLTPSQAAMIDQAEREYLSRDYFPKALQKRNIIFLLHGVPVKIELDHIDETNHRIHDTKTTNSITTFDPEMYDIQTTLYALGVELKLGIGCDVALNVTDKHSSWSRSHQWIFSRGTLQSRYYQVEQLVQQWGDSTETGIFPHVLTDTPEGLRTCWNSPFWSVCPFCKTAPATIL